MNKPERKRQLVGPWRNLHAAVWLIGLAIIFWKGWWWPGILVLAGVSLLVEAAIMQFAPHADGDAAAPAALINAVPVPASVAPAAPLQHRLELLPATCPNCGGPLRGKDVKWTGPQSADCPYCGVNLPMQAAPPA